MNKFIIYSVLLVLISSQLDICMNDIDMNDISDIYRDLSSPQILTLNVHVSHETPRLSYYTTGTSEFPV